MYYDYLKQENLIPVPLAKEEDIFGSPVLKLNEEQEARAIKLHQESIIVDFHNHLTILPKNLDDYEAYARHGRIANGYKGLKQSGLTACFQGYGGSAARRSCPRPWQFDDIVWDMGMRQGNMDHHGDVVRRGFSVNDIYQAKEKGICAVFAMVENTEMIGNDIDKLDVLYGLGIRGLGLSYSSRTAVADGAAENGDGGLSRFGYKVVERLNRLGILIDFAHSSDRSTKEGIEASEAPCCSSHTFARSIHNTPRGMPDENIKLLAKNGGVIGVEAVPNTIALKKEQSVFDIIDHVDYIANLVGVEHVALGSDTMFGDHVAMHDAAAKAMGFQTHSVEDRATHVEYLENPSHVPNVTRALVKRGYSDDDIKKIMGLNVLNLLQKTIG